MYEWRSHTAEIELAIRASTEEEVFADAVAAFAELVATDQRQVTDCYKEEREVVLEGADRASLLVEWLQEVIFLADTESFVAERAVDLHLEARSLAATLVGRRAPFDPIVKAATYHGLQFARHGDMWHARVVLDV
jgi:SHS2 domain-containing protein